MREKRLAERLGGGPMPAELVLAVRAAQVTGSLQLAGADPTEAASLHRALDAVDPAAAYTTKTLLAWHDALRPGHGLRASERERPGGPPPAPADFIAGRLEVLEQWLSADSGREMKPEQQGALLMARIVEILPFDDGNGRIARLAASHAIVRAGGRPPVLDASDDARLKAALQSAFKLDTQPLVALLEEAGTRALDVMLAALP